MTTLDKYLDTKYCFQVNDMIVKIEPDAFKRLAQLCDFNRLGQLSAYTGPGNEVAALLSLLNKKSGKKGLAAFYEALSEMPRSEYLEVQEAIRTGPCKELFCSDESTCK